MKRLIIAIDGPAGAGKSTVSKALAGTLGYTYIDTGAMYRAVAWKAFQLDLPLDDNQRLAELAESSTIVLQGEPERLRVFIDDQEVTDAIRTQQISEATSVISTISGVRRALVAEQQRMGQAGGVVLEGRDIGTQVFPNADVKFYLDADLNVRAKRRWAEERAKGRDVTIEQARQEVEARDRRDRERQDSPLQQPEDAIYIDSSHKSVEEIIDEMLEFIHRKS